MIVHIRFSNFPPHVTTLPSKIKTTFSTHDALSVVKSSKDKNISVLIAKLLNLKLIYLFIYKFQIKVTLHFVCFFLVETFEFLLIIWH